ncbi:KamA family radical SAM protein [Desulfomicrobium baculatum]|uniref:L-lysine 2,3-aminomutase n=1 Tax=Desulfomicrobium baculatum (strain DSM 4028 / VKM B-1378 / X) TaxID=525897 RepID=C7LW49_DESBD|nr:KamA family radical SAM protein [Desulfomicrobium baculatum]ACU89867.1 lysine 2,3-aminomutase YodO family protein [Desulfomicrobium baculatum DSM 4028]
MDVVEIVATQPTELGPELAEPPSLSSPSEDLELSIWAHRKNFMNTHFPGAVQKDWDSWRWQLKHRVTSVQAMAGILGVDAPVFEKSRRRLPAAATPYYLWVASRSEALRRCILPDVRETQVLPFETSDPLGEEGHSPVPGIVHRYPDRVLFLVTEFCSTYCRYCTRSRLVGKAGHRSDMRSWQVALDYIRQHDEVRDVLLSGGDPLTLPAMKIEWLLSQLRAIPHVEIVRIGSKVPAVLPQRITPNLVRMLRRYHPLFISLHFTHPDEITPDTALACNRLADGGIPLGSQTVLLSGVNDDVETMKRLMHGLVRNRVRPYYMYQCDPIPGSSHFRTPVDTGLSIIQGLRGHTSGYCIPTYVIDAPGGGGKVPLQPGYFQGRDEQGVVLRNYEDRIFHYPDQLGLREAPCSLV